MPVKSVAILGAGHGGFAAAADLTSRGYEVRLQARNADRLKDLRARGGACIGSGRAWQGWWDKARLPPARQGGSHFTAGGLPGESAMRRLLADLSIDAGVQQ